VLANPIFHTDDHQLTSSLCKRPLAKGRDLIPDVSALDDIGILGTIVPPIVRNELAVRAR